MKFSLNPFKGNKLKLQQLKGLECLNCDKPLVISDNFCSYCGQKNRIKLLNFSHFINNMFSGFFSYDSRFWKTFIPLLTKPGKVSKDYIQGKRARFVNPFQMYLNVSIIFFLILGVSQQLENTLIPNDKILGAALNMDTISAAGAQQIDSITQKAKSQLETLIQNDSMNPKRSEDLGEVLNLLEKNSTIPKDTFTFNAKSDSTNNILPSGKLGAFYDYQKKFPEQTTEQALVNLGYEKSFWNTFYYQQVATVSENYNQFKSDGGKSYIKKLTSYISISLFVFLPFFTLFLKLLYLRRKFSYMEHLVFVFHTQTVFFLLIIIFYLMDTMVDLSNVFWVFILLFLLYLYKALRKFYEQRRFKTIVKFMMLNGFYMFLASIGFAVVAVLSFILD